MNVTTTYIHLSTQGDSDIIDITNHVKRKLESTKLKKGIVTISVIGSTAGLTTCEYEPGLVQDLKDVFAKIAPQGKRYNHDDTWGDSNGHAHVRASLLGPSLTFPFVDGEIVLGTWQQIIFIDFDNRPRERKVVCQFMGE